MTDDIAYFTIDGAPGRYLKCAPLRSTLSETACAKNWTAAQDKHGTMGLTVRCRSCRIGATHANAPPTAERSALFGEEYCPRCRRGATRLIRANAAERNGLKLCCSCWNRLKEQQRGGKNCKGTAITFHFDPRRVGCVTSAGLVEVREPFTSDAIELIVATLRVANEPVAFCRPIPRGVVLTISQLSQLYDTSKRPRRSFAHPPKRPRVAKPSPRIKAKPATTIKPARIVMAKPAMQPPGRKLDHGAALDRLLARRRGTIVV
jgi:hypothetical protein